jgi:hydroxyacylglutathione hydrolase
MGIQTHNMLEVASFTFNPFQENTYIIYCRQTLQAIIIDPGCMEEHEQNQLIQYVSKNKLQVVALYNTHCHIDHILGNDFVMATYSLALHLHKDELHTYNDANKWVEMLGMGALVVPTNLVFIDTTHQIRVGEHILQVYYTPGHSVASLCFVSHEFNFAITGDVLFYESIGRTDLPGGDFDTLMKSIKNICFSWPESMTLYPGHGSKTTIAHEKKFNPFVD